jgi:[acyl-carrier-protein] S-malonyltransferase
MASAAAGLAEVLEDVVFTTPTAPVVANQDGIAYVEGTGWRQRSAEHVTVPVRWRTSMETLASSGADAFVEVGSGSMIAGLAKRTLPDVPVFSCSAPSDLEHLSEVLAS